jgi:hypothetical protein
MLKTLQIVHQSQVIAIFAAFGTPLISTIVREPLRPVETVPPVGRWPGPVGREGDVGRVLSGGRGDQDGGGP